MNYSALAGYLWQSSLLFSVAMVLYAVFLRDFNRHLQVRIFLLTALTGALIGPLLSFSFHISTPLPVPEIIGDGFSAQVAALNQSMRSPGFAQLQPVELFVNVWIAGFAIFGLKFLIELGSILSLLRNSEQQRWDKDTVVYRADIAAPFTFMNRIFIPAGTPTAPSVILHEKAHADQWHSLDLFVARIYRAVFWFNPFAWYGLRRLQQVHEYLADQRVVHTGFNRQHYQQQLLSAFAVPQQQHMLSMFQGSSLKRRILMLNRQPISKLSISRITLVMIIFFCSAAGMKLKSALPVDLQLPIQKGHVTSPYGQRMHPIKKVKMLHRGIDIGTASGTPVFSAEAGKVIESKFNKNSGQFVIVEHDDQYQTFYSQLSERKVKVGDHVEAGQIIGLVGSSGLSTAPHLHFEVIKNGKRIDPESIIDFSKLK